MANKRIVWLLIAAVSLLVVGCTSAGSIAASPTPLSAPTVTPTAVPMEAATFTIIYDNVAPGGSVSDLALRTRWGFA